MTARDRKVLVSDDPHSWYLAVVLVPERRAIDGLAGPLCHDGSAFSPNDEASKVSFESPGSARPLAHGRNRRKRLVAWIENRMPYHSIARSLA